MLLDEKIVGIERALSQAGVPHAFGGALALAYYAAPRATHDIDVNVFVPATRAEPVLAALAALGADASAPGVRERIARDEQVRILWERTPIDLFFSYDPLHDQCALRRRRVDFAGVPIHVLSPEDLIVFKVIFDRAKDWRDIAEMVFTNEGSLDLGYVRGWLERILAQDDARLARFERIAASGGADLGGAGA